MLDYGSGRTPNQPFPADRCEPPDPPFPSDGGKPPDPPF